MVRGPYGETLVSLAIDTGASRTMIRPTFLQFLGCHFNPNQTVRMTSASNIEMCSIVKLNQMDCLGFQLEQFEVVSHHPPKTFLGDGLLGLDFLQKAGFFQIDFSKNTVSLFRRPRWQFWR